MKSSFGDSHRANKASPLPQTIGPLLDVLASYRMRGLADCYLRLAGAEMTMLTGPIAPTHLMPLSWAWEKDQRQDTRQASRSILLMIVSKSSAFALGQMLSAKPALPYSTWKTALPDWMNGSNKSHSS